MNSIVFSFLIMMLTVCGVSFGAQDQEEPDVEEPVIKSPLIKMDTTHTTVSEMIESMAKRFDRFFTDDRDFEETNKSSIKVSLDLISDEDKLLQLDSRVRTRVSLPGTQRRLRLLIESDPEELDPEYLESNPIDTLDSTSNYIIGLEGEQIRANWQIRPSVGIRWSWPLQPYTRLRAIRYFDLDRWLARFSTTAAWFSSEGVSLTATNDFDRRLNDRLMFRSTTKVRWKSNDSLTSASQVFSLFQKLNSKASLAYDIGVVVDDESDWRVTDQFIRLRYRRLLYKTWAFLEIQPRAAWPENNDYREELSLLVRLELNFGQDYL